MLIRSDYASDGDRFKKVVTELLEYCDQLMVDRKQPHLAMLQYGEEAERTDSARYRHYIDEEMAYYIYTTIECKICPQYASFVKCKKMDKKIQCWKGRHTVRIESDTDVLEVSRPSVEPNNQIKFRITHVVDPNQFFVQVLSYRSANQVTGEWLPTNDHLELARVRQLLERRVHASVWPHIF